MRDYDPTTGRYMQADPLGLVDGASVYGYALQNPGRYTDPRGLFSEEPWNHRDMVLAPGVELESGGGAGGSGWRPNLVGALAALGAAVLPDARSKTATEANSCSFDDCDWIYDLIRKRVKSLKRRFRHQYQNKYDESIQHIRAILEERRSLFKLLKRAREMGCLEYDMRASYLLWAPMPAPGGKFPPSFAPRK